MASATAVSHDPLTENKTTILDDHGQSYTEDPQVKIDSLTPSQVREGAKAAASTVRMIRGRIRRGELIPAIVITKDNVMLDGNSTVTACRREKKATVYALRLDKTEKELGSGVYAIGSALNQHGRPMGPDAARVARQLVGAGYKAPRIARDTGLSEATIRNIGHAMQAEEQLKTLRIKYNGLPGAVLTALGRGSDLNQEPWSEVARLMLDAGLNAPDINALMKRVRATKSDEEAMELLVQERKDRAEQIELHKLSGNGRPPVSRTAVSVLKRFVGLNDRPEVYVERNPELSADALDIQVQARALLDKIIAEQEQVEQAEGGDDE